MFKTPILAIEKNGCVAERYELRLSPRSYALGRDVNSELILLDPSVPLKGLSIEFDSGGPHFCVEGRRWHQSRIDYGAFRLNVSHKDHRPRIVLFGVLVLFSIFFLYKKSEPSSPPSISTLPNSVHPLPTRKSFQAGEYDRGKGLRFSFDSKSKSGLKLAFRSVGVRKAEQVVILLNGHRIGFAQVSSQSWISEQIMHLPAQQLRYGKNLVEFRSFGASSNVWGVKSVYLRAGESNTLAEAER